MTSANDKYERFVSLACVTYSTVWGDKTANMQKMKRFIEQAADQENDIVVFPELALTGYQCSEEFGPAGCLMHRELAETIPGPATEEIAAIAKKRNIYVVFGMPEREREENSLLYISAPIIGPDGFVGNYRKVHLMDAAPAAESKCFTPGDHFPVFETKLGIIGIQICLDFWTFPEGCRILTMKGAEIILNPTASLSGPGKEEFMVHMTCARGVENMVYAASANLTGKERTLSCYGHSTIAGRGWKINEIFATGGPEEGIVSATLNMAALRKQKSKRRFDAKTCRVDVLLKELQEIERAGLKEETLPPLRVAVK